MKKILVSFKNSTCPIWIGDRILDRSLELISQKQKVTKAFVFVDRKLVKQAQSIVVSLSRLGWDVHTRFLSATESLKDFREIYHLQGWLLKKGAHRDSMIFAVGGGVIGDSIGFLAGTYMRGIPWVVIPTTLLAQVDSSIGGKTGVNHELGKNLLGVFHQPSGVICDTAFLRTLSSRDLLSGFGEIIKYGLVFDPRLFETVVNQWHDLNELSQVKVNSIIHQCVGWKVSVVEKDERDLLGVREALNFGHTLGHAIEAEAGYKKIRHGEAVILGMRMATHLSVSRGYLKLVDFKKIDGFLKQIPIPPVLTHIEPSQLLKRLKWDKKNWNGKVRFVLLKKIGKVILDSEVKASEILSAIMSVKE